MNTSLLESCEYLAFSWCDWKQQSGCIARCGGVHGVMVIVVENGHCDTSSNPERDWLHFT